MAYTRSWNNTTPAGTRAAKEIDDAIREAKVDIYDRILSLLDTANGATIDDDPLVLKGSLSGKVTDKQLLISPHILHGQRDDDDIDHITQYVQADDNASFDLYGQVVIPVGYVIKLFEAWIDPNGASSVKCSLNAINVTSGGITNLTGDLARATAGIGVLTSAALNYTVQSTDVFSIRTFHGGSGRYRVYGFRITYDRSGADLSY